MKGLGKKQRARHTELWGELDEAEDKLQAALDRFKEAAETVWDKEVQPALDELNEIREKANEFIVEVTGDAENYYNDRTEKWQEGDAGQALETFRGTWENGEMDPLELEMPDLTVEFEPDAPEFEVLPAEVE